METFQFLVGVGNPLADAFLEERDVAIGVALAFPD
jgi:hypothetical protein